jgi:hypothetical protein
MTPYELRFAIFKQAYAHAQDEYHAAFTISEMWNKDRSKSVKMDYPDFPSYEYIEELANKINTFVSSK